MLSGCWLYETPHGVFRIEWTRIAQRSCFAVIFEQDLLGCYETASTALTCLINGETQKPRCGLNIWRLGLPPSLVSWTFCPATGETQKPYPLRRAGEAASMKRAGGSSSLPVQAPHPGASL
jgi:hypothetical protein